MITEAIELRIYVEGVLLPSATGWGSFECTSQRGGPTTGALVIPAIPGLRQEEWTRARVTVAWSDLDIRATSDDWPILFDGEIVGDSFSKSPGSRHIVFYVMGPEVYWQQCKLYFYSTDRSPFDQGDGNLTLEAPRLAMFFGNSQQEVEGGTGLTIQNKIISKMQDAGADKPLPSLVRRIFKDCLASTNFFFARANDDLKLDRRFAQPRDDNVGQLYAQAELFFQQIEGNVGAMESATSIGAVLDRALALMRYELIRNPQPRLMTGGEKFTLRTGQERERLLAAVDKDVTGRMGLSLAELGITGASGDDRLQDVVDRHGRGLLTLSADAPEVLTTDQMRLLSDPAGTDADLAAADAEKRDADLAFLKAARDELARISAPATEVDQNSLYPADEDQATDELAQFILLPETDFSLPPVCNVIFPSDSASYALSRDHLQEPTRSVLSTPTVANNVHSLFFAPDGIADARIPARSVQATSPTGTSPPVRTGRKTSRFGLRVDPLNRTDGKALERHPGLDIGVADGTEVFAFDAGKVIAAREVSSKHDTGGPLKFIAIAHGHGLVTQYLHLSAFKVSQGDSVISGQLIGLSGHTGPAKGPHLHFEYIVNGEKTDPEDAYDTALANFNAQKIAGGALAPPATSASMPEKTLVQAAEAVGERFDDFKYLTPEEDVRGIVPIFDTSLDKVSASFERDNSQTWDQYCRQYALASFERAKYASRGSSQIPMPWSPGVACGFPALIIDPVRSMIAQVDSVTHRFSVQGGGDASTVVGISGPRHWDEGDPYYWRGGLAQFTAPTPPSTLTKVPDADVARFPAFYLASMVPSNSYARSPLDPGAERFGGEVQPRAIDGVYGSLLGVPAIPYFYAEDTSPVTGATIAFNQAVDGINPDTGERSTKTLVGYYESLMAQDQTLAHHFARGYTRRLALTDAEYMRFVGAEAGDGGYVGGPFREALRQVVKRYVLDIGQQRAFRG